MTHPELIVTTLDRHLDHEVSLVLYGRSSIGFLRPEWESQIIPITRPPLRFLRLFRPATLDLILTKMMRGDDAQDLEDVAFLIRHDAVTRTQLEETFRRARLPEIQELHDAFAKARPLVLAMVAG